MCIGGHNNDVLREVINIGKSRGKGRIVARIKRKYGYIYYVDGKGNVIERKAKWFKGKK